MTYLIIFCAFLLIIAILILIAKIRESKIRRALQIPTCIPAIDDSFDQAKEIGKFLSERANVCGMYFHHTPDKTGITQHDFYRIASGEERSIVQFIRTCHLLGCEIVIRQNGTDDIEPSGNTPTIFAEKIFKMKQ